MAVAQGAGHVVICAAIEAELSALSEDEKAEYLAGMGLAEPGLNRVIRAGHELLGLLTFFTVGPKEARAWTVHRGATAPQAAGCDPHRFRARLHLRRGHRATTISSGSAASKGQGSGPYAP